MSLQALKAEFPLGTPVYDDGKTTMRVVGWLDHESLIVQAKGGAKAGVPAAHARFFKEHFTDRAAQ